MILNYFKLAFRLLLRSPFVSALNILGLAVGFACFFILWNYTQSLLASDQYHLDADRIVRLGTEWKWTDDGKNWGQQLWGASSPAATRRIIEDFPEVEDIVRIQHQVHFGKETVGYGSQIILSRAKQDGTIYRFREKKGAFADANVFAFFTIPLALGDPRYVLEKANSIVLSQSTSKRFFGESNPIGHFLILNSSQTLTVTGVFHDLPHSSHLEFDFVISNRSYSNTWDRVVNLTNCYLKVAQGTDIKELERKINKKVPQYFAETLQALPHVRIASFLQPLNEVLFSDELSHNNFQAKSKTMLVVFSYVAIAILLMAWANYINLTLARISGRIKEVSIRKISGAKGKDFAIQFVVEAIVVNGIGILLALTMIQLLRRPAEIVLNIRLVDLSSLSILSFSLLNAILLLGVLVTAVYPALVSSSYNPISLFTKSTGVSKRWIPSLLTTCQYVSAVVLIFFGIIVQQQLQFVLNKDVGFNSENVLTVEAPVLKSKQSEADFLSYLKEVENEKQVLRSSHSSGFMNLSMQVPLGTYINIDGYGVNENYLTLFEIALIAGRNFVPDDRSDVIILSRYAAQRLNFTDANTAIGHHLRVGVNDTDWKDFEIIGVTENFRFNPFYRSANTEDETGRGVGFIYGSKAFGFPPETVIIKLGSADDQQTISNLEKKFTKIFEGNVFTAGFVQGYISNSYIKESVLRNQLYFFTALAVMIACMGVIGMMSHRVVQKTKEIGIRKVLGAGYIDIILVLLKNTLVQIFFAVLIGFPLALHLSMQYLAHFTDRIQMQWWYFAFPVTVLSMAMIGAILWVLLKAVCSNPVKALKYE
jgi:putative ABC transport system permease protein